MKQKKWILLLIFNVVAWISLFSAIVYNMCVCVCGINSRASSSGHGMPETTTPQK